MQLATAHRAAEKQGAVEPGARPSPASSPDATTGAPAGMPLFLRRAAGGGELSGDLAGAVQAKLTIGRAGDAYEQEADRVAEAVKRPQGSAASPGASPAPGDRVQRQCACGGSCEACAAEQDDAGGDGAASGAPAVQRKSLPGATRAPSVPGLQAAGDGVPLAGHVRARVEPVLGADLGHVRVHNDPAARDAAWSLYAKAFTHRNHIFLGPGQSSEDVELLAHEATHVVQQSGGGAAPIQRLAEGDAVDDGAIVRARVLRRIDSELGRGEQPEGAPASPARTSARSGPAPAAPRDPVAAERARSVDRTQLAAKRVELAPVAQPDVDRPAAAQPQVERAAAQTTEEATASAQPAAGADGAAAAPPGGSAGAEGRGGAAGAGAPGAARGSAAAAAGLAEQAFAAAAQPQPEAVPEVVPPRPIAPVDAKGMPLDGDPATDAMIGGLAVQAQALRDAGLNLRQHAAEERGNAQILRGNLALAATGIGQAEVGVQRSTDHLTFRRQLVGQARGALAISEQKAATVAEGAPGFSSKADEGKQESGPMAREAGELASENAANAPDDAEAAQKSREQGQKLNQTSADIGATDGAISQTKARAESLGAEAAQASRLNAQSQGKLDAADQRLAQTEERLGQMGEHSAAARVGVEALQDQPDLLEQRAQALDAQGEELIAGSIELERRLHRSQEEYASGMKSVPGLEPEPEPPREEAGGAAGPPDVQLLPEDHRYEDRAQVNLAGGLPSWFTGVTPSSARESAEAEQRERERRQREVREINAMAGGHFENASAGEKAWIALRMTGRHLFSSASGIRWPGFGHLALGLVDPRGPLMGVVSGLSMALSGVANLASREQWRRDPLGNALKSAADIATGLTIILGSVTALAGLIIAILGAITILSLGTAAPVTGPIIAFCATVLTTVGGWTIAVGKVALVLQALVLIKNLIDAACAQTAGQLQNQSDKITSDVGNAGNVLMQMGMAKLGQVGGRAMQSEISAAGGGIAFARQMGQQGFVSTAVSGVRSQGLRAFAGQTARSAWSGAGSLARGARGLFTRQGASEAWGGIKGAWREVWADRPQMSLREGTSRGYLVGERPPAGAAAEGAGAVRAPAAPAAEAPAAPRAAEAPAAPRAAEAPATPATAEAPAAPRAAEAPAAAEAPRAEPTARPTEQPTGPRAEPAATEPTPQAREASVQRSGHKESAELSTGEIRAERQHLAEHPERVEGAPPHRSARVGEHEWREQPDGGWCRFSGRPRCFDADGNLVEPSATPAAGQPFDIEAHLPEGVKLAEGGQQRSVAMTEGWRDRISELTAGEQDFVYVLRDAQTGEILKVGRTTSETLEGRFGDYLTASHKELSGRQLQVDVAPVTVPDTPGLNTLTKVEDATRSNVERTILDTRAGAELDASGSRALPWDNTDSRLGYEGPGTPGVVTSRMRNNVNPETGQRDPLFWKGERIVSESGAGPPPVLSKPSSKPSTAAELQALLDKHGSQAALAKHLGVHRTAVNQWVKDLIKGR
ncbi:eCIS core domain-containing protein [Sorangium sp. So ce388]|uniref:eCIS core domain-containing protein n=1 Tax=Sorangium sp. So ce388 TaxID=3133309 RepID=UPI003F5BC6DC